MSLSTMRPTELFDHAEDLEKQVQRLQRALNFWMPCVPNPGEVPKGACERLMDDSTLLAGFDEQAEPTAEELGWIKLQSPPGKSGDGK